LYDLVLALAEDNGTYNTLLQLAGEVENERTEPALSTALVDRSMEIRSSTGYVGLYNPRAICYMNSLLTQLFMNMTFRRFILKLDVKEASGSQRLLFETQRLFAHMQNSFRKSADPRDFAACVKSLDKTPIDITVQMDADEFYNLLFDQWEAQLLKQEHKQQFRSFYGGQTLNQIKSKECEHVSERVEPFFAVQCDIAGKANLQESLQAYVQGDVMEGDNKYKCESCDGKFVDAVKRTCLKDAPDNLIFHLKRFEFDLNDFSRRKIYDHFAFPETLDISPYKADYLSDPSKPCKEDVFDLVGVLVHTGTCENGHYYSYIRQRPSSSESTLPTWIEFNDSEVSPFDPTEIADRTFGGFTEGDGYTRQVKQFSAYMLFYERRATVDEDQRQWVTNSPECTPKIAIPKFFENETNTQNAAFIREYSLFDPVHTKFVRQLHSVSRTVNHGTCSEDHGQETRALHIILAHLSHIAWRQYNAEIFQDLFLQLRRSILSCAVCCGITLQRLAADDDAITNIILKCTHPRVRSQMRALIIAGLKFLREKEPALYGLELSENDMEVDTFASIGGILVSLTRRLRTTADETAESTRGWEDYYLLLTQMVELGHLETAALLDEDFLYFCLRLFCMHTYPPFRSESPELARIMEKRRGIFNRLICFLWTLLSQMDLKLPVLNDNQAHDRLATLHRGKMKFPLHKREIIALGWWSDDLKAISIVDKILEVFDDTNVDHFYPGDIIRWMLESPNDLMQTNLCRTMTEGLMLDPPYCDSYIYAALPFCEACPKVESIHKVIGTIAKTIGSPNRAAEDRLPSGEAVLGFFAGLLKAENEHLFEHRHPHAFHQTLMLRSRTYGIALLCHHDEHVRKATHNLFQKLYGNTEAIPPETVVAKFDSARDLLGEMIHKFVYEKEVGRHLSYMMPLVDTCRLLAEQLYILTQSQEPDIEVFQDPNDTALICQFQQEVEARLRSWPHDADTPISQEETYDQSDYASESDDAHDLLDN
jgi:ubiquitin carboxyl-terminal hydrolase 34